MNFTLPRRAWARTRPLLPHPADLAVACRRPRRDLVAGMTVAIVALPLALGFGIASGMGPAAGLTTAVVAGAVAAVFGGSNLQVSGPTGAMTVVLAPLAARHGPGAVLIVGLLAGLMLLSLSLARVGRYMRYVPAPVVGGFTLGIACVIGLQQVPAALGVPTPDGTRVWAVTWAAVEDFAHQPNWPSVALALGVAAVMLGGARWRPGVPFSILAVIAATVVAEAGELPGVSQIGELPAGLPAPSLSFLEPDPAVLGSLLAPALVVAALAALESLLSASVADGMTPGQRHDPDRELFGQGLANLAAPLFGGIPASGATARTAVNVRSGAGSRLAALVHAAALAAVIFTAAPLVARIPLAALAGVLLATAVRMVEVGSLRSTARATRSDAAVLGLTATATVALDLVYAVLLGLLVAGALALRAVARQARLDPVALHEGLHEGVPPAGRDEEGERPAEEWRLLADHIVSYRLDGPLFFAAAHRFLLRLRDVGDVPAVILRMSRVTTIDASGALALHEAIVTLERRGIAVYVSGIRAHHHQPLEAVGVLPHLRRSGRVFPTTPEAIDAANAHLRLAGAIPAQRPARPVRPADPTR